MNSCIHTHTVFCDGEDTPQMMAAAACKAGIRTLGFSGHSFVPAENFGMPPDRIPLYRAAVAQTKRDWEGRLEVLCGIELDEMAPAMALDCFDYVIGSAHGVRAGDGWVTVDDTPAILAEGIRTRFDGDGLALAAAYYEQFAAFLEKLRPDLIGHFDLVRKFNAGGRFFDERSAAYRTAALTAVDRALALDIVFEVNTGAMAKGWRKSPYPAHFLLERIREKGGRVTVTTDAHSAAALTAGAKHAEELLRQTGFASVWELTGKGWQERAL